MPRAITVADDTHRREQEDYRSGLEARREPEIGRADTAVVVAVYGVLRDIACANPRRSRASRTEFISRAADVLAAQGYNRERSVAVLKRRLETPPTRFLHLLGLDLAEECDHYAPPSESTAQRLLSPLLAEMESEAWKTPSEAA